MSNGKPHPATAVQPRSALSTWNAALARRLRTATRPLNFREIALLTNANSETVRRYLRDGNPSVRFLARVCTEFQVRAEWLLGLDHKPRSAAARNRPLPPQNRRTAWELKPKRSPQSRRRTIRTAGAPVPPVPSCAPEREPATQATDPHAPGRPVAS